MYEKNGCIKVHALTIIWYKQLHVTYGVCPSARLKDTLYVL